MAIFKGTNVFLSRNWIRFYPTFWLFTVTSIITAERTIMRKNIEETLTIGKKN